MEPSAVTQRLGTKDCPCWAVAALCESLAGFHWNHEMPCDILSSDLPLICSFGERLPGNDLQSLVWTSMNGCSKRPSSTVFPIWNVGHVVNKARWVGSWFLLGFGIALRGYFKIFFCACVSEMIDMGVLWFGDYWEHRTLMEIDWFFWKSQLGMLNQCHLKKHNGHNLG